MKKSKQFVRVEAKEAMIDGVMAGVRENTAQLFKVMSSESTPEQERRTSRGLEQIQLTAITMIRLIEKLGKTMDKLLQFFAYEHLQFHQAHRDPA